MRKLRCDLIIIALLASVPAITLYGLGANAQPDWTYEAELTSASSSELLNVSQREARGSNLLGGKSDKVQPDDPEMGPHIDPNG